MATEFDHDGQRWSIEWHAGTAAPAGTPHGALAVCSTAEGAVVLVSERGTDWGFPAGRPEPGEDWRDVMVREVREEACGVVEDAALLGFTRGVCVRGAQRGDVLVRSVWRAAVILEDWAPAHEMVARRVVAREQLLSTVTHPPPALARAIVEAAFA